MKTKTNKQTKNDNKYGEKERNNQTETFKKGTKEQRKKERRKGGRKEKKKHRKVADQENGCHVNDSVVDFNKKKRKRGKGNKMKKERN